MKEEAAERGARRSPRSAPSKNQRSLSSVILTMRLSAGLCVFAFTLAACGPDNRAQTTTSAHANDGNRCQEVTRDLPEWQNFTPPTHTEGDRTVMPIVFSDGTTAELVYPPQLDLASLGVSVLNTSGVVNGEPGSGRGVSIRYGVPPDSMKKGQEPSACYEGAHGQAEVWESGDRVVPQWMFVPLHSWTASIYDGNVGNFLSEDHREAWATRLAAEQRPDGWVFLRPTPELKIGPQHTGDVNIELGDLDERALILWPIQCRANPGEDPRDVHIQRGEVGGGQAFASWCDERGPMEVHVYADEAFIRNVAANLEIRNVRHADDPAKYHIVP
jgi:hypothetical protein